MKANIIYEDKDIIVCHKKAGVPVQTGRVGKADMVSEIKNYLKQPYLGLVHRLDQPVEGVMVFAKHKSAAASLSAQIEKGQMTKCYYALAMRLPQKEGKLTHYLIKDNATNSSRLASEQEIKDGKGKKAELEYQQIATLDEVNGISEGKEAALYRIHLLTGRHHQIRVQFASAGGPLIGDRKYGNEASREYTEKIGETMHIHIEDVALCAYHLEFVHPGTKKKVCFEIKPEGKVLKIFS